MYIILERLGRRDIYMSKSQRSFTDLKTGAYKGGKKQKPQTKLKDELGKHVQLTTDKRLISKSFHKSVGKTTTIQN